MIEKSEKKKSLNPNHKKAFITNAVTEVYTIETEAQLPVSSDASVEDARDWANDGSKL